MSRTEGTLPSNYRIVQQSSNPNQIIRTIPKIQSNSSYPNTIQSERNLNIGQPSNIRIESSSFYNNNPTSLSFNPHAFSTREIVQRPTLFSSFIEHRTEKPFGEQSFQKIPETNLSSIAKSPLVRINSGQSKIETHVTLANGVKYTRRTEANPVRTESNISSAQGSFITTIVPTKISQIQPQAYSSVKFLNAQMPKIETQIRNNTNEQIVYSSNITNNPVNYQQVIRTEYPNRHIDVQTENSGREKNLEVMREQIFSFSNGRQNNVGHYNNIRYVNNIENGSSTPVINTSNLVIKNEEDKSIKSQQSKSKQPVLTDSNRGLELPNSYRRENDSSITKETSSNQPLIRIQQLSEIRQKENYINHFESNPKILETHLLDREDLVHKKSHNNLDISADKIMSNPKNLIFNEDESINMSNQYNHHANFNDSVHGDLILLEPKKVDASDIINQSIDHKNILLGMEHETGYDYNQIYKKVKNGKPVGTNDLENKAHKIGHSALSHKKKREGVNLSLDGIGNYQGEMYDGMFDGYGILSAPDKSILYEGEFERNHFCGIGIMFNNPRETVDGSLFNGKLHDNWIRYEGVFDESKREGFGELFFKDDSRYVGEFSNDQANGFGTYYLKNERKYAGTWRNNELIAEK